MIVNARMYSVTPAAKRAWEKVLAWALERAGLDCQLLEHAPPALLSELWARDDLGCAFMCGLPYSQRRTRPRAIVAPVPSPARYGGRPVYFTDIVVRSDAPYETVVDTFGGVAGYTLEDSMSGCVAFRAHLLPYRKSNGPQLYREVVGGLVTPRRVIEALVEGQIDVGPLDSYVHDLIRRNEPQIAAQLKVIATTVEAPIPLLVATAELPQRILTNMRDALLAAGAATELAGERNILQLQRFVAAEEASYRAFDGILAQARQFPGLW